MVRRRKYGQSPARSVLGVETGDEELTVHVQVIFLFYQEMGFMLDDVCTTVVGSTCENHISEFHKPKEVIVDPGPFAQRSCHRNISVRANYDDRTFRGYPIHIVHLSTFLSCHFNIVQ